MASLWRHVVDFIAPESTVDGLRERIADMDAIINHPGAGGLAVYFAKLNREKAVERLASVHRGGMSKSGHGRVLALQQKIAECDAILAGPNTPATKYDPPWPHHFARIDRRNAELRLQDAKRVGMSRKEIAAEMWRMTASVNPKRERWWQLNNRVQ